MIVGAVLLANALVWTSPVATLGDETDPLVRERITVIPLNSVFNSYKPTYAQFNAQRGDNGVRVQVSVNMFLPGATDESDTAEKLRDQARRSIYKFAAHECDVLKEVLAKDCRLEGITVNVMRQQMGTMSPGYNVNGQITLQITLRPETPNSPTK